MRSCEPSICIELHQYRVRPEFSCRRAYIMRK
jgi:hypothetical protein